MIKKTIQALAKRIGMMALVCGCLTVSHVQPVYAAKYYYADNFSEGLLAYIKDEKLGYMDKNGKTVISRKGDFFPDASNTANLFRFYNGLAPIIKVIKDGTLNYHYIDGYINKKGKKVIQIGKEYNDRNRLLADDDGLGFIFGDGLAIIGNKDIIDTKGKKVATIKKKYDRTWSFQKGYGVAMVGKHNTDSAMFFYGLIDKTGKEILKPSYSYIGEFNEGLAVAIKKGKEDEEGNIIGKCSVLDLKGREVIKPKYDYISTFKDGVASVRKGKKWGIINKSGKEIVKIKYHDIFAVDKDLYAVQDSNKKWGLIDNNGKKVTGYQYDDISTYNKKAQRMAVMIKGKLAFINKKGKVVLSTKDKYEWASSDDIGLFWVGKDGKVGMVDKNGKVVIPLKYKEAWLFDTEVGLARVKDSKDRIGFINTKGKAIIPFRTMSYY